ncbi:MAG: alpha/beta hydrolase [Proteobacteria bacterium]|nr:alpha/beta hydrolase [Pseudomonadota bacterium]
MLLSAGTATLAALAPFVGVRASPPVATSTDSPRRPPSAHAETIAPLPGFAYRRIATSGAVINVATRGEGPPLLLLHGFPENHRMWAQIAPSLAQEFSVICADLRGYGDSSKPEGAPDHSNYSKRAMATDMVEVMAELGHREFLLAGHDRGGRVAYRLALDHPQRVRRLALLDIVSTKAVYEQVSMALATAYYHWYFLIQPRPLPERLIGSDPEFWLRSIFGKLGTDPGVIGDPALKEYLRTFATPEGIHAACEDYRAGASVDLANDRADVAAGRKIACPTLLLWGARGVVGALFQPLETWRDLVVQPTGEAIDCGHFIPEEKPDDTLRSLATFFRS